jgi:hypothetical protein
LQTKPPRERRTNRHPPSTCQLATPSRGAPLTGAHGTVSWRTGSPEKLRRFRAPEVPDHPLALPVHQDAPGPEIQVTDPGRMQMCQTGHDGRPLSR